jgi:hypothetical protein
MSASRRHSLTNCLLYPNNLPSITRDLVVAVELDSRTWRAINLANDEIASAIGIKIWQAGSLTEKWACFETTTSSES